MEKKLLLIICLCLAFCAFLFPGKAEVLSELNKPSWLCINGQEIYILDDYQVLVYSLKDYKLLRKFGKKGEGPGELLPLPDTPLSFDILEDRVLLNSFNKLICYSKEGKMLEEKRIVDYTMRVQAIKENYLLTSFIRAKDGSSVMGMVMVDRDMNRINVLYENSVRNDVGKGKVLMPMIKVFPRRSEDRIYVFDQQKGFWIKVFDIRGKFIKDIELPYTPIKTDNAFKKKWTDWIESTPAFKKASQKEKDMLTFSEYLPVIRSCIIKGKRLYVQTYLTKGELSEFYILDLDGKLLKKVMLPGADQEQLRGNPATTYDFSESGDQYYYLLENMEEEQIELHIIDVK